MLPLRPHETVNKGWQPCITAGYVTQRLQRSCWHSRPATPDLPQMLCPAFAPSPETFACKEGLSGAASCLFAQPCTWPAADEKLGALTPHVAVEQHRWHVSKQQVSLHPAMLHDALHKTQHKRVTFQACQKAPVHLQTGTLSSWSSAAHGCRGAHYCPALVMRC